MKQSFQREIIRTSLWTLFFAFVTFSYGIFAFGWIFPKVMADVSDSLNAYNAAAMYYERVYNANKTPENLYNTLDRYIKAENYKKIIVYSEKFLADDDYTRIIKEVNTSGEAAAQGNATDIVNWANEDNRIKCWYTVALLETSQKAKADGLIIGWYSNPAVLDKPLHAFFLSSWSDDAENAFIYYHSQFVGATNVFALDFLKTARLYGF